MVSRRSCYAPQPVCGLWTDLRRTWIRSLRCRIRQIAAAHAQGAQFYSSAEPVSGGHTVGILAVCQVPNFSPAEAPVTLQPPASTPMLHPVPAHEDVTDPQNDSKGGRNKGKEKEAYRNSIPMVVKLLRESHNKLGWSQHLSMTKESAGVARKLSVGNWVGKCDRWSWEANDGWVRLTEPAPCPSTYHS